MGARRRKKKKRANNVERMEGAEWTVLCRNKIDGFSNKNRMWEQVRLYYVVATPYCCSERLDLRSFPLLQPSILSLFSLSFNSYFFPSFSPAVRLQKVPIIFGLPCSLFVLFLSLLRILSFFYPGIPHYFHRPSLAAGVPDTQPTTARTQQNGRYIYTTPTVQRLYYKISKGMRIT